MTNYEKFSELGNAFKLKINKDFRIALQFEISDASSDNFFQVKVKDGSVTVYPEPAIAVEEEFILSSSTLDKLFEGIISPLTAFANEPDENGEMSGLINPKRKKTEDMINSARVIDMPENNRKDFYRRLHVFDVFFNKHPLGKVAVSDKGSRILHGVKGIGLYHDFDDPQQLAVYFKIEKSKTLYQPGIEKGIFVLNGSRKLKIGADVYEIGKYEYYRIKTGITDTVEISNTCEQPLEILYV